MKNDTSFQIISFTADKFKYYPANIIEKPDWMDETFVKHTEIEIPIGKSRYGGPIVDLPKGIQYPKTLRFVAQLDLAKFSPFDKSGLLPKKGQLIFFADIMKNKGKVIYSESSNKDLTRVIIEHDDNFFLGTLIDKIYSDTESFNERYMESEGELDYSELNEDGKTWDSFAGSEKSKIFGIFTNCQQEEELIRKITLSEKILLLQIGENDFNDEGVFSVSIPKEDLKNLNFNSCEFQWSQS
jgi:uncharacterized protein YwqG